MKKTTFLKKKNNGNQTTSSNFSSKIERSIRIIKAANYLDATREEFWGKAAKAREKLDIEEIGFLAGSNEPKR